MEWGGCGACLASGSGLKLLCSPSGREELPPWLDMATADLLELSRWGATWNAVVEQLSKANAILAIAIDRRYPTNRCARRHLHEFEMPPHERVNSSQRRFYTC